jgi:hypothetical protein
MIRSALVSAACLAAVTLAGNAQASVVIDFQSLEVPGNDSVTIGPLDYLEDSYRLVFVNASRLGTGSFAYYGSTAVYSSSFFSTPAGITLTQADGGPFDLLSIDLVELGNSLVHQLTLTGTFVGGGTISTTLSTDAFQQTGNLASFETFALTGFTNLADVVMTYPSNSFTWAQMDNLVVRPTIPTPGAVGLLALGGLIATRRRR